MSLRLASCLLLIAASTTSVRADGTAIKLDSLEPKTSWGIGVKLRRAYAPQSVQKLFMGDTPGTATMDGMGIDFARRREGLELVFGFGYDGLHAKEGYYLEKGGDPLVPGKVDYVTFSHPHWYTAELSVIGHVQLHKLLELRYGAGIGAALVRGTIRKTDAVCTSSSIQSDCMLDPAGTEIDKPADIPPVLPVINVLIGLQLRPIDKLHIHLDVGLHTVPYIGLGAKLYLW